MNIMKYQFADYSSPAVRMIAVEAESVLCGSVSSDDDGLGDLTKEDFDFGWQY